MEQSHKGDVCGGFMMPENISYLIIGNGIAGVTAAEILRNEDSAADITVIADDPFPVYYRPALKDYLAGRVREDKLWARPNSFYQDHHIRFLSDHVLQQERRDGVDVRLEEGVAEIMGKNGEVSGVITTSGARIPCDMLIIAIGVEPIIDFIKSSGIPCGRGVQVDSTMRTSAPDVYAAGDVLETTDTMTGRIRVIGQWFPAISQGRAAAYSMLGLLDSDSPFRSSTFYNST